MKVKGSVSALKLAKIPQYLKKLCWALDLELEVDINSGWIREDVYYTITGPDEKVALAMKRFKEACNEYQQR